MERIDIDIVQERYDEMRREAQDAIKDSMSTEEYESWCDNMGIDY